MTDKLNNELGTHPHQIYLSLNHLHLTTFKHDTPRKRYVPQLIIILIIRNIMIIIKIMIIMIIIIKMIIVMIHVILMIIMIIQ